MGYDVLARNVRIGGGELDIVAVRTGQLRFVEVKARAPGDDTALESLRHRKRRRLRSAAEAWMLAHPVSFDEVAFMVAEVVLHADGDWALDLIDDAFDG